jgi:hypothetical protein
LDTYKGELHLDELDEVFSVGQNDYTVVQWDSSEEVDGTIRFRAIFVNEYENVKVAA